MKFSEINKLVKGIPFINESNAKILYDFIIDNKLTSCLELGFAHGTASCYIAAALDELGEGSLTSVDLIEAENIFKPGISELLTKTGLEKYVTVHREKTGYNWFLHDTIKKNTDSNNNCSTVYDLCIIDGPKNWTIDGSAFFCADKLLKKEGWLIFDDYNWTYNNAGRAREATDGITHRQLSEAELIVPHIKEIFHLLVMQHPSYSNFKIQQDGDWAWAQKIQMDNKKVSYTYSTSFKHILTRSALSLIKKLRK
ncbi:MAG TPA: class I SAM-dependent methyltransferase [Chitinophagaceae bacterium]|jgi:predicted O-methyltransferase YrrM|nr:class I SAM-dependent methyltransferase [Chitinophagaceae bacterium]